MSHRFFWACGISKSLAHGIMTKYIYRLRISMEKWVESQWLRILLYICLTHTLFHFIINNNNNNNNLK